MRSSPTGGGGGQPMNLGFWAVGIRWPKGCCQGGRWGVVVDDEAAANQGDGRGCG
jgi:hypothetical protein